MSALLKSYETFVNLKVEAAIGESEPEKKAFEEEVSKLTGSFSSFR
jgi:ASC-1-like (ASCH) protein